MASRSGTSWVNSASGVNKSSQAPATAPASVTAISSHMSRPNAGSWLRSHHAADRFAGIRATRLTMAAAMGERPVARSAGKVTSDAPPTIEVTMPPASPMATRLTTSRNPMAPTAHLPAPAAHCRPTTICTTGDATIERCLGSPQTGPPTCAVLRLQRERSKSETFPHG
jgi:hypothetical protein